MIDDGEDYIDDNWVSSCGTVEGHLGSAGGGHLSIFGWGSRAPGRGHTKRVLRDLRRRFLHIRAVGIGRSPSDDSWRYWQHMYDEGLIDSAEDDEGHEVEFDRGKGRKT